MKLIMKFGGTSVDGAEKIQHVSEIIKRFYDSGNQIVVVISAMAGVTDELINLMSKAAEQKWSEVLEGLESLKERHWKAIEAIKDKALKQKALNSTEKLIEELKGFLKGILIIKELTPRARDYILSFGEQLSTNIVSLKLRDLNVPSKYLTGWEAGIVTDSSFGSAKPIMSVTERKVREVIEPLLSTGVVPVVTGFIASTENGYITTLGRGGSDYTASILGAVLKADEIWIWTDVDGIMTTDPKIEPNAKTIAKLSYDEAAELAYFGAKVLQPYMIKPAKDRGVPIRVKNTFNPQCDGTLITRVEEIETEEKIVKAIGINNNISIFTIRDLDIHSLKEVINLIEKLVEDTDVILLSQSFPKGNLSIVIPKEKGADVLRKINELVKFKIECENDVSLIAVVGSGMKGTPGVAAKIFQAVAEKGINIKMIAQGPSELNISFIVKKSDSEEAVRAIHKKFKLGG